MMETPTEKPANFEFAALNEAKNYRAALIKEFSPVLKGRVLEVGAGIGQITSAIDNCSGVTEVVAVEPDPQFIPGFRQALPKVPVIQGTADAICDSRWNAIVCVNVLEHIEQDERELRTFQKLLSEARGHLCLFVPARPEIYARIDKDFGHFRRYTRPELKRKLIAAGFQIVRLNYFNVVGYFAWWANFCVLRRRVFDIASVRLFDRVIFPVVFGIESNFLRPPFGQSLIAVVRAA
jgi:2-polyprenyl-3-methyl-5-hydroxy-6-metoxy-1,4-benzoquinol methylase